MYLGLPDLVYFKVAVIILSSDIKYVCGYKIAIEKIDKYVKLTASTTETLSIATLGDHRISDENETRDQNETSDDEDGISRYVTEDGDDSADREKYFTALIM